MNCNTRARPLPGVMTECRHWSRGIIKMSRFSSRINTSKWISRTRSCRLLYPENNHPYCYNDRLRHDHLVGVATSRESLTMPRAPARPKSCETVLKAVRELRVGQKHAGQISKRENLRFIAAYAVEI